MASIINYLPDNPSATTEYAQSLWKWFNSMIIYASDEKVYDTQEWWASLVPTMMEAFKNNRTPSLRGDCEDYTLTMAEMLLAIGWPENELIIVRCATPRSRRIDHVVLWIRDQDSWLCADCWVPQTLYRVGGVHDPGHRPIDGQNFPIKPNGWRTLSR